MKKILLMSLALMFILLHGAMAQTRTISGRVTDQKSNEGLPGVTVLLKGTSTGVSTNATGAYSLTVPEGGGTLVYSSVGMATQERALGTETQIDVALAQDSRELSEVVVTALGIERDTRSLGYATQQIKADQISQKSEPNVLSALQGKVAGVTIQTASGLPGASTNITIRGVTSFSGSNQPLFVVDGIPINNSTDVTSSGGYGSLGAPQTANRALDIDPETVESINILKGPSAAALYGSRASAGAIIITTKGGRGAANKKLEVTVTSGLTFQNAYGLAKLQKDYGQGSQMRNALTNGDVNSGGVASWGPRYGTTPTLYNGLLNLDGSTGYIGPDGTHYPYQFYANRDDFYQRGRILTNGVNINGGNTDQNVSLNISNTDQKGITATSFLKRTSVQLGGNVKLLNKLRAGGSVNFIQTNQSGPQQGNGGSSFYSLTNTPTSYPLQQLPYQDVNGNNIPFTSGNLENPYFSIYDNPFTSNLTRFINVANLSYDVTPWLNIAYRAGLDTYTDRRKSVFAKGASRATTGSIEDDNIFRSEINGDLLVTLKKDNIITEGLSATLLLGQNINQRTSQIITSKADNLLINGFPNASLGTVFSNGTGETSSKRRLLGYYGQLSLAYNNYLFVELTGRADQSSTLPVANNTYFYPSATLGFVFTDAFKISSDIFSYGKIRVNAARVGRDAAPYSLDTKYIVPYYGNNVANVNFPFTNTNGTYGGFALSSIAGGGQTLRPEFTNSFEVGGNLGFFNNRVTLDLTYFQTSSRDQIFRVNTAPSSGIQQRNTNVGRLDNKGFEALATITPVKGDFRWDLTANFTRIRNEVVSIAPGVTQSFIGSDYFNGFSPAIKEGMPYGVIVGGTIPRVTDPASPYYNQYIVNGNTGIFAPLLANQVIANPNPKWQGGLQNTFAYKGLSLSVLVDANVGAQLFSYTNYILRRNGLLAETANRTGTYILPGVIANADGTYRPNNIQLDAQTYYQNFSNGAGTELNVYDATVYRLRELTLAYSVPKGMLEHTPFGGASISFTGRNLFYIAPNVNFDPDISTQGAGNSDGVSAVRGLEIQSSPNTRNYGVNLRFTL